MDIKRFAYVLVTSTEKVLKRQKADETAEWLYGEDASGQDGYLCSKCGFFEPWYYDYVDGIDYIKDYNFCPGCRRKMTTYTGKPK